MKKSIHLEGESDLWKFEYDGRYQSLLLVCKKAEENKGVIKINGINHVILNNLSLLIEQLDTELFGPKGSE